MLVNVLQELLDVGVSAPVEIGIIDIYYHILEIVFFLFPLQVLLEFWQRKGFEEHLDAKMFEIIGLN